MSRKLILFNLNLNLADQKTIKSNQIVNRYKKYPKEVEKASGAIFLDLSNFDQKNGSKSKQQFNDMTERFTQGPAKKVGGGGSKYCQINITY